MGWTWSRASLGRIGLYPSDEIAHRNVRPAPPPHIRAGCVVAQRGRTHRRAPARSRRIATPVFRPAREENQMPAAQETSNKATVRRFHDALSGGPELVLQAIDEIVAPDVLFHAPVPTGAT